MKKLILFVIAFISVSAITAQNFNPIIPDNVADPSVSKFGDTYYLYGTTDIDSGLWKMGPPVVWKSKDFVNWSFEGVLIDNIDWNTRIHFGEKSGFFRYWAPGRTIEKDGLYYLFPTVVYPDGKSGVFTMVSEKPEGPFRVISGDGILFNNTNPDLTPTKPIVEDIDGEIFTDDDGQSYFYWRRRKAAKISEDFTTLVGPVVDIPTKREGYSEGPAFFKRNGIYYYLYTIGGDQNYCYGYMMSKEGPLSGFYAPEGKDFFISSSLETGVWGPGHGNIFYDEKSGKYIFVYLEFGEGSTTRQVFANELTFNEDGTIRTIIPDFKGVGYLGEKQRIAANLSLKAQATASSIKSPHVSTKKVETNRNYPDSTSMKEVSRTFDYKAGNAIDESNGTRWVASKEDKEPWIMLDFGKKTSISKCEMYFVFPASGHAWILEKSDDGINWTKIDEQHSKAVKSPHISDKKVKARYLRLKITDGEPGLWEFKVRG